jgi:adenine-specific DNA-methyltransferase
VLKLLRETYLNRVKMIYIDPPYNTGHDFVYEDDFAEETGSFLRRDGQFDEQGNRLSPNLDSNGRFHTDWLNMIYPRLRVARDLLTDDGVIFISIDDGEVAQLRKVCDEIYGEVNFIAQIMWEGANKNDAQQIGIVHEYVLVYSRNRAGVAKSWSIRKDGVEPVLAEIERLRTKYGDNYTSASESLANWYRSMKATPSFGLRRFHKIDAVGAYKEDDPTAPGGRRFNLINPMTGEVIPLRQNRGWSFDQTVFEELVRKNRIVFVTDKSIMVKRYLHETDTITPPSVYYQPARSASERLARLIGKSTFDYPKDETIIKKFVEMTTGADDSILDFFSGSATTAHSVIQLNAEDGGKRKFIMVQLPEVTDDKSEAAKAGYKNICEIGKERIRRAGANIKADSPLTTSSLDVGFRVLKLDSSNMKDVYYTPDEFLSMAQKQMSIEGFTDNIKEDRSDEDLLFQVILDLGIPLSAKITQDDDVYYVNDNCLIACFKRVDTALITEIAKQKPYYAVFRDSSFTSDSAMVNFEQVFATYSPNTIRRVL